MLSKFLSKVPSCAPLLAYSIFKHVDPAEEEAARFRRSLLETSCETEATLRNFIGVLERSIAATSSRYRENILRQIAVLTQNDAKLLEAEEFAELQAENERLREHLKEFRLLAENSGKMAFNQAVSALHSGSPDPKDIVCHVYCSFEKLYVNEYRLNTEYENNLSWIKRTVGVGKPEEKKHQQYKVQIIDVIAPQAQ